MHEDPNHLRHTYTPQEEVYGSQSEKVVSLALKGNT